MSMTEQKEPEIRNGQILYLNDKILIVLADPRYLDRALDDANRQLWELHFRADRPDGVYLVFFKF